MSAFAFFGAVEIGFVYAFVAIGVLLSFRVLNFPDLTVDGSFVTGAAVAALIIVSGGNPWLAVGAAFAVGCVAGLITAGLNLYCGILHLLASILTMIALYSVNLRIMGRPNISLLGEETLLTPVIRAAGDIPSYIVTPFIMAALALLAALIVGMFLLSQIGLAMRAVGVNADMARAQGVSVTAMTLLGMALANGFPAVGGALFAQIQGSADISMGVGVIIIGLASVIGGEALLRPRGVAMMLAGCIIGSLLYRIAVAIALESSFIGLKAQDLNLVTAILVALALTFSGPLHGRRVKRSKGVTR